MTAANQHSQRLPCCLVHDERKTRLTMTAAVSNSNACLSLSNYVGESRQFGWLVVDDCERLC